MNCNPLINNFKNQNLQTNSLKYKQLNHEIETLSLRKGNQNSTCKSE